MASYELERRGTHYDDLRAGTIASMVANVNRNVKARPEPYGPLDFIFWNDLQEGAEDAAPILLDDPEAQSRLIDSMMFPKRN